VQITETRIKLMDDAQERLQAFCSITIDGCFVIRDLKIIKGTKGAFVAMPSRKLTDRCPRCSNKNCLRAVYCSQCGVKLPEERAIKGHDGRAKLYADIAHPINSQCREMIQTRVLAAYDQELILARQPGYVCRYDEFGEDGEFDAGEEWGEAPCTRVTSHGDTQHRIEPAAAAPGAPHVQPAIRELRAAAPYQPCAAPTFVGRDDEFGAGII
jgi:stage V sporulation protein G